MGATRLSGACGTLGSNSFENGRGGEIRTPDPHNPIVVRYQAALRPDRNPESRARARSYRGGNLTCHREFRKAGN